MKLSQLSKILSKVKKYRTIMITMVVLLWMVTLVSSNYANHQNLERNDLSQNVRVAEDEWRLLHAAVSELQTTERIENESKRLNSVQVQRQDIIYLDNSEGKVALK